MPPLTESWVLEPTGIHNDKLGSVWLAAPQEVSDYLILAGHIERGDNAATVRIEQAGLVLFENFANPGFCFKVPLRNGLYSLTLWHEDQLLRRWDVLPSERAAAAMTGMVSPRAVATPNEGLPYAILGRMGELFLAGDSNDSVGQFTENRRLSASTISAWNNVFSQTSIWQQRFNLDHISILVTPAKEEIKREYYPFIRARSSELDEFMSLFGNQGVIFPKWELWRRRDLAWSPTDTHWTDFGASIAAEAVQKAWSSPSVDLPKVWSVRQRIGDLGIKMQPPVSSYELTFVPNSSVCLVFDNGVSNQGNVRIYRNSSASLNSRLMIFGDSFGTNLAEAFAHAYSEVIYAYQPAGFDPQMVHALRPDRVLLQITQRFLPGQPATGKSVFEKAREKISQLSFEDRGKLLIKLTSHSDEFSELVRFHL